MFKYAVSLSLLISFQVFAHEGHDHGPAAVPVQKGGIVRSLETVNLELVFKDKTVSIYPFKTEMNPKTPGKLTPADIGAYPVSATVEMPKAKPVALALKPAGDHWEASVDAKGVHRFTVVLDIKQGGHSDKVKWTVEPGQ